MVHVIIRGCRLVETVADQLVNSRNPWAFGFYFGTGPFLDLQGFNFVGGEQYSHRSRRACMTQKCAVF
jgi:hypothetical protein